MAETSNGYSNSEKLSGGTTLVSMALSWWQRGKARKYNQEMEVYRNKMRRLQDAHSQDAITVKEIYASADAKRHSLANEVEYLGAKGTLAVKGAISGFSGRTSRAISNSALRAKQLRTATIEEGYARARRSTSLERLNSAFGTQISLEDGWVQPINYLGDALAAGEKIASLGAGK